MFSTLHTSIGERRRRRATFICGLVAQCALIGAVAFLAVLFPDELSITNTHFVVTWLPELTPPEKPVVAPPREPVRVVVPKLNPAKALELPAHVETHLQMPKIQPVVPAPPPPKPEPPTPVPAFTQRIAPRKEQAEVAVRTGGFGGASLPVTTKRPADQVQTGGFGSPEGVPGRAQRDAVGNVPKLGSFGLPEGPGVGNGTGWSHGGQGVVASAGFGSGVAGSGNAGGGNGSPQVAIGGFTKPAPAPRAPAQNPPVTQTGDFQPVEIISKPTPVYTEEARRLGIQGEVTLSVVFQASGTIRVMSVVKSLGHGLDQAAQQAAMQIRFKPARRSGQPEDFPATLRIQFRLGGQPS